MIPLDILSGQDAPDTQQILAGSPAAASQAVKRGSSSARCSTFTSSSIGRTLETSPVRRLDWPFRWRS